MAVWKQVTRISCEVQAQTNGARNNMAVSQHLVPDSAHASKQLDHLAVPVLEFEELISCDLLPAYLRLRGHSKRGVSTVQEMHIHE